MYFKGTIARKDVYTHTHTHILGSVLKGKTLPLACRQQGTRMKCLIRREWEPGGPELSQVFY